MSWWRRIEVTVAMRLIGTLLIGLTIFWLAACSPGEKNAYRSSNQQRTIEHGLSVTITNVASEREALPFAEQYCHARGRMAHFDRMEMLSYHHVASESALFDCVPRPE
jgi:hypothetical protein